MFTPLKIDTSAFDQCVREIARYTGVSQQQVTDAEFGKVIEAAIKYTPAAAVSDLRDSSEHSEFTCQPETLYEPVSRNGQRSRQKARRSKKGKLFYSLENHYPDALWAKIVTARKASLTRKLRARGLAKQSWQRIARVLGIDTKVPGYVAKATPSRGPAHPENASASRIIASGRYGIHASNSYPLIDLPTVRGRQALQRAINGRVKFFQKNLQHGVFWDLKKIAQKYPGIVASGQVDMPF